MNKNEFLQKLKEDLSSLSDDERMDALKYYEEYFAEAEENNDGGEIITEFATPEDLAHKLQDVIEKNNEPNEIKLTLEVPEPEETQKAEKIEKAEATEEVPEIVIEIKKEENNSQYQNQKQNQYNKSRNSNYKSNSSGGMLKIILIVCTFPFWLPLLMGLASVVFALFMTLFAVAFAVAAMAIAGFVMAGAGFMSLGYGIFNIFINISNAFYPIGAGLVTIGLGIIMAYVFTKLTIAIFKSQFKFAGWAIRGISGRFLHRNAQNA